MKKCSLDDNLIATGGKENDLKLWNLESEANSAYFKAKNVIFRNSSAFFYIIF